MHQLPHSLLQVQVHACMKHENNKMHKKREALSQCINSSSLDIFVVKIDTTAIYPSVSKYDALTTTLPRGQQPQPLTGTSSFTEIYTPFGRSIWKYPTDLTTAPYMFPKHQNRYDVMDLAVGKMKTHSNTEVNISTKPILP